MKKLALFLVLFNLMAFMVYADLDDENKLSINLNTSLENSFSIISKISDINIFLDESIQKNKTLKLKLDGLTIREALDIVLKLNALKMEKINNNSIIIFPEIKARQYTTNETRTFYLKNASSKDLGNLLMVTLGTGKVYINTSMNSITINANYDDLKQAKMIIQEHDREELYIEKTYFLSYVEPKDMATMLTKIANINKYSINEKLDSITIIASDESIDMINDFIGTNDIKPPQVEIEVLLLDASDGFTRNLGINWKDSLKLNLEDTNAALQTIMLPESIIAKEIKNLAEVLSNPSIRVINKEKASINIGDEVPIVTSQQTSSDSTTTVPVVEYKNVGIQLTVTPKIHSDSEVTINLNLEVSSLGENLSTGENGKYTYPSFTTKNIETIVRLKHGETAVFGGLISDEQRNDVTTIPFLGDIPVLGYLFRKTDKSPKKREVIMLITPKIISNIKENKAVNYKYEPNEAIEKLRKKIEEKIKKTNKRGNN